MGSRFDDFIYWTSLLQLHLVITAHTLNSFWKPISAESLPIVWIWDWSLTLSNWAGVLCYNRRSVGQSVLKQNTHLVNKIRFSLLSDSRGFVDVGRSLWQEDGSVVCNCCWPLPVQSFSDPSPVGLATIFHCLRFETCLLVAFLLPGSELFVAICCNLRTRYHGNACLPTRYTTTGMCLTKRCLADGHIPTFRRHVTILWRLLGNSNRALANHGLGTSQCLATTM
jgi:hypothetical protein